MDLAPVTAGITGLIPRCKTPIYSGFKIGQPIRWRILFRTDIAANSNVTDRC
jgi:hypothetical protein